VIREKRERREKAKSAVFVWQDNVDDEFVVRGRVVKSGSNSGASLTHVLVEEQRLAYMLDLGDCTT
jgi:hypothetical protein